MPDLHTLTHGAKRDMSAVRMPINTLVIIHLSREYEIFHRRHLIAALAEALPDGWAVLCVNRPITLDALLRRSPHRLRRAWREKGPRQVARSLFLCTPCQPTHELIADRLLGLPRINRRFLHRQLRHVIAELFGNVPQVISWISDPVQRWVWGLVPNEKTVYECYDDYARTPAGVPRPRVWRAEQEVLAKCDLAFFTAQLLAENRAPLARSYQYLPNGVPAFFLASASDQSITNRTAGRPQVGYLGYFYDFMAVRLLEDLCHDHPEWDFTFAGAVPHRAPIAGFRDLPNVSFIGPLPYDEIPYFLGRLDVALIPFEINAYVQATNPLKTYEYMAAGVPIVASDLPELHRFGHLIRFVENTPQTFAEAIRGILAADRETLRQQLIETARQYTWENICRSVVVPELLRLHR